MTDALLSRGWAKELAQVRVWCGCNMAAPRWDSCGAFIILFVNAAAGRHDYYGVHCFG